MLLLLVRLLLINRNHHATPLVNRDSHMTDGSALIGRRHCSPLVNTGHVFIARSLAPSFRPARVVDNPSSIGCVSPANSGHVTDNRWHVGSDIPASTADHATDNRPPIGCASPACSGHVRASRSLIRCVLALVFSTSCYRASIHALRRPTIGGIKRYSFSPACSICTPPQVCSSCRPV